MFIRLILKIIRASPYLRTGTRLTSPVPSAALGLPFNLSRCLIHEQPLYFDDSKIFRMRPRSFVDGRLLRFSRGALAPAPAPRGSHFFSMSP